jgi:hypothetical protein
MYTFSETLYTMAADAAAIAVLATTRTAALALFFEMSPRNVNPVISPSPA